MVAVPAEGRDGAVHAPEGGDGVWAEQRGGGQHQQPPPPHHLPLLPGHPAHPDHLPGAAGKHGTAFIQSGFYRVVQSGRVIFPAVQQGKSSDHFELHGKILTE